MISGLLNKFSSEKKLDRRFWKHYSARADLYKLKDGKEELKYKEGIVSFGEQKDDVFKYFLVVQDRNKKEKPYHFPLTHKTVSLFETLPIEQKIKFEFVIDKEVTIVLVFPSYGDSFEAAGQFRKIICCLMYQSEQRNPVAYKKHDFNIFDYCSEKKELHSDKVYSFLEELKKQTSNEYSEVGQLYMRSDEQPEFGLLEESSIFSITKGQGYKYRLTIYNAHLKVICSKDISDSFSYEVDDCTNRFVWIDKYNFQTVCFCFIFEKSIISLLNGLMTKLIMETQSQKSLQQIIEKDKNGWNQYYYDNRNEPVVMNDEEIEQIDAYGDEYSRMQFEQVDQSFSLSTQSNNSVIRNFVQGKTNQRAFVNKGDTLDIYKYNENVNEFNTVSDVFIKDNEGELIDIDKFQLTNQDSRIIFTDNNHDNKFYDFDLNKCKIVNTFRPFGKDAIQDISVIGGKEAAFQVNPLTLSISTNGIKKLDSRIKEPVVEERVYKTKVNFDRVLTTNQNNYVIGSKTGDLRLFDKVGGNARNLIPSLFKDGILDIDSSKDGKYCLVTYQKYITLMPTFKGELSAFKKTFRKDAKPRPIVLRISPSELVRIGITEPNFTSARFDDKKDRKEAFIVASCANLLLTWNLAKVLRGNTTPTIISRTDEPIIKGEFVYNRDNLLTAMPKNMLLKTGHIDNY